MHKYAYAVQSHEHNLVKYWGGEHCHWVTAWRVVG